MHALTLPVWIWIVICAVFSALTAVIIEHLNWRRYQYTLSKWAKDTEELTQYFILKQKQKDAEKLRKILDSTNLPEKVRKQIINEFEKE